MLSNRCNPSFQRAHRRKLALLIGLALLATRAAGVGSATAQDTSGGDARRGPDLTAGEWLLRRARTIGLSRERLDPQDAERVLIWAEAAGRAAPQLADAFYWQHILNYLLERPQVSVAALETYCRLRPDDLVAQLDLFDRHFEALQTARDRIEFCQTYLSSVSGDHASAAVDEHAPPAAELPAELASHVHRRLGELYLGIGETDLGRRQFATAVELLPQNVAAHAALLSLARAGDHQRDDADTGRAAARVEALLHILAANPARAESAWELAHLLDQLSLHEDASLWYRHAMRLAGGETPATAPAESPSRSGPNPALARLLADFARNRYDTGKFEAAFELANRAQQLDPAWLPAQFVLIDASRQLGRDEVVAQQTAMLRRRCETVDPKRFSEREAASSALTSSALQAAWFYLEYGSDPAKARALAEPVSRVAPDDTAPRRILGLALLAAGELAPAESQLAPIAGEDQMAAYGLAQAQLTQGRRDAALLTLRRGEALRRSGQAYDRIAQLLGELGAAPAPPPDRSDVQRLISAFDQRVLRFPFAPAEFLALTITPAAAAVGFGEPWQCTLGLANRGPFPITLGADQMLLPEVLLVIEAGPSAVTAGGLRGRSDAATFRISLLRRRVLQPGEAIRVEQRVDLGPVEKLAAAEPARSVSFTLSAILDPAVAPGGAIRSKLPGLSPAVAALRRGGIDPTRRGLDALVHQMRTGREATRIIALRSLAALRAYRKSVPEAGAPLRPVDENELNAAMKLGLADPAPIVRAHAVFAFEGLPVELEWLDELARVLADPDALVRLAVLDELADLQGTIFRPVAASLAESDPDDLVRRLARLYLQRWESESR